MRITDSEVIKNGEQDLIDAITGDLDWGAIDEIFQRDHKLKIGEDVEYTKGDIVAVNNQVAYRLEFDIKVPLSVLLDRGGNYISVTSSGDADKINKKDEIKSTPGHGSESGDCYEKEPLEIDHPVHSKNSEILEPESLAEVQQVENSRIASQTGDVIG